MNCKTAEKLIFELVFEDIETEDKKYLLDHLNCCLKCRESYYQFKELLRGSEFKDQETEPRYEILDRLQQIARINSQKDETFIKKYLRMPILVPVFGAAMALMIFLNFGVDYDLSVKNNTLLQKSEDALLDNKSGDSTDSGSMATVADKDFRTRTVGDSEVPRSLVVRTEFSPRLKRGVSISDIDDEFFKNTSTGIARISANTGISPDSSQDRLKAEPSRGPVEKAERSYKSSKLASSKELKVDIAGENISYNVIVENGGGFEVASTVNNPEELLSLNTEFFSESEGRVDSTPVTSAGCDRNILDKNGILSGKDADFDQKKQIYKNIAECYELEGNWQKAIDNYKTLKDFDSSESAFYQNKIKFIKENHIGK